MLQKSEKEKITNYKAISSIKEITEGVRTVINSRETQLTDQEVFDLIEDFVLHDEMTDFYNHKLKNQVIRGVFNATRKDLDLLQDYADDKSVSEIMVNGIENIFIERHGKIEKTPLRFETKEELEEIIRRLGAKVHREINELNPILDARLEDGSRVNAVYKNVAVNGPILTIRRFPEKPITMEELIEKGSVTKEAADFIKILVVAGYNIFVSGGTSSGKTTLLNVMSNYIPKDQRVIVIEDSAELQITQIENIVRMECKNANVQGVGQVTVKQLIKTSLRMRPDRIIVGEVRGEEVVDMVQAMNTGHDGSLSTGHGNSPEGMISRLEAMFLQGANFPIESIRKQIGGAIEIIVHLSRMPDKSRKILEISEVEGYVEGSILLNPLYRFEMNTKGGVLKPTGNKLKNREKLIMNGVEL